MLLLTYPSCPLHSATYYEQLYAYIVMPPAAVTLVLAVVGSWYLWARHKQAGHASSQLPQTPKKSFAREETGDENPGSPPQPSSPATSPVSSEGGVEVEVEAEVVGAVGTPSSKDVLWSHAKERVSGSVVVLLFMMHDKLSEVGDQVLPSHACVLSSTVATHARGRVTLVFVVGI
jgi:hypothetical protein